MAHVSYLRPTGNSVRPARPRGAGLGLGHRRGPRRRHVAAGLIVVILAGLGAAAVALGTSRASLSADPSALARLGLPLGGGTVESVSVTTGPHSQAIPVSLRGAEIWPRGVIGTGQQVTIDAVVKRPGWISWLTGSSERLHLTLTTPIARLKSHFLTLRGHSPIRLAFRQPIRKIAYGTSAGHLRARVLAAPRTVVNLARIAEAGSLWVAAAPRSWESAKPTAVSWFPAGSAATAVASPAPGAQIAPSTPITLTFSKPVAQALGKNRPPVSPATAGAWQSVNAHTIVFRPQGYGYGLAAKVSIGLPSGVRLIGAQAGGGSWTVPAGSTLRLQQLLANLGYLPLRFQGASVPTTPQAQEAAAVHPPAGQFTWRYPNIPAALRSFWSPGASGVMTRGALMAFENEHGLVPDGVAGPAVWRALIDANDAGRASSFGYTFVDVHKESSPQTLSLWHNGRTVLSTVVNTGIAQAPTASGTFPVFEHLRVTTMSGTNPDGSHYHDPGIQFVSYFNGGDALHAFTRAQYGFPQSLGCVEMALGAAGQVWPYTPIGTLVHVA